MAGVLTDQSIQGAFIAPLALTTTAAQPQFLVNGKFARTGNATVPIPGTGRTSKRRFRVAVTGTVKTTITNNVTLNILIDGTVYATSGAKAVNSKTGNVYVFAEFLYDPAAANISGQVGGHVDNVLVAASPLTATVNVPFDVEGHVAGVSALVSSADAGAVLTISEVVLEVF